MGHKIFVSYKYGDDNVNNFSSYNNTKTQDYVEVLYNKLHLTNNIYKGEHSGEDLSHLTDNQIWEELKDKIYDSTLTIVLISPNMKEDKADRYQWIPWEISYSLKEKNRRNKSGQSVVSNTNAMLAVVLPDRNNSYSYYFENKNCCFSSCITHHREILFDILANNTFNLIDGKKQKCINDNDKEIWQEECSYIKTVKWDDFIYSMDKHIKEAYERLDNIGQYNICKEI